jgi:hypothetical protein
MGNLTNTYATTLVSDSDYNKVATLNALLQILDDSIAGILSISTTGGTITLTGTPIAPQAQHMFLNISGVLASNAIIEIPVAAGTGRNRIYAVKNATTGAFSVTIRKVGGTGVTVTQGSTVLLLYNGSDIQYLGPHIDGTTGLINAAGITSISARVYNNADISVANASTVAVTFNSERYDTSAIHSTSVNTDRLTLPFAGKWRFGATVNWDANATGTRALLIEKNGSTFHAYVDRAANAAGGTPMIIAGEDVFAINDYIRLMVVQNSGGSLNLKSQANYSPEFWCSFAGA